MFMVTDSKKQTLAERTYHAVEQAAERAGKSLRQFCSDAGVSPTSVYNLKNRPGQQGLSQKIMQKLADEGGVSVAQMFGEGDTTLPSHFSHFRALAYVQAGYWQEATEMPEPERPEVMLPDARLKFVPKDYHSHLYCLIVRGDSMDIVFPEGTALFCLPIYETPRPVRSGDYVIVERINHHGEHEATVKQIELDDSGRAILRPRSNNPEFQQPLIVSWPHVGVAPTRDIKEVRVTGLVALYQLPTENLL